MKAARWFGNKDVRVVDMETPEIKNDEVLIDVQGCGICGSDLHGFQTGALMSVDEEHPVSHRKAPLTMGHEYSGIINSVGKDVTNVKPGDRVVVEPLLYCGTCNPCKEGYYNTCDSVGFQGLNGDGAFADQTKFKANMIHKIPSTMSFEDGALVEPLTVAYHSLRKGNFEKGMSAIVSGAGTIGLSTIKCLKAMGAGEIYVIQRKSVRQEYAKAEGATVIDPNECDAVAEISKLTGGKMADVAFETTGSQQCYDLLVRSIKNQGTVVITSIWEHNIEVNLNDLVVTEKNVVGTICYNGNDFEEVIKLIGDGVLDTTGLITKKIALEDIVEQGFGTLTGPDKKKHVKVLVIPETSSIKDEIGK